MVRTSVAGVLPTRVGRLAWRPGHHGREPHAWASWYQPPISAWAPMVPLAAPAVTSLIGAAAPLRARAPRAGDETPSMPTYLIEVVEHRTYEIDADSEAAAIERASADPEQLPVGSLVSLDRRPPRVVPAEHDEPDGPAPPPGYDRRPSARVLSAPTEAATRLTMPRRGDAWPRPSSEPAAASQVRLHRRVGLRGERRPRGPPHARRAWKLWATAGTLDLRSSGTRTPMRSLPRRPLPLPLVTLGITHRVALVATGSAVVLLPGTRLPERRMRGATVRAHRPQGEPRGGERKLDRARRRGRGCRTRASLTRLATPPSCRPRRDAATPRWPWPRSTVVARRWSAGWL